MRYFLIIALVLNVLTVCAQTDSSITYYFRPDTYQKHQVDTGLTQLQRYNKSFYGNNFYAWNGAIGLASKNLYFKPNNIIGFDLGRNSFDLTMITNDSVNYYHTRRAHSEVSTMLTFQKKEQFLNLFHTQNITKNWNAGFKFYKTLSQGYLFKQQTSNSNFLLFTSYTGKRYELFGNYIRNYSVVQENGGVVDSLFIEALLTDKKLVNVNLNEATNKFKTNNFNLLQKYKFKNISTDSVPKYLFEFGHSSSITRNSYSYTDVNRYGNNDSAYYKDLIYDKNIVNDSIHITGINNEIFIGTNQRSNKAFQYKLAFENQQLNYTFLNYLVRSPTEKYHNKVVDATKTNNIGKFNLSYSISSSVRLFGKINYVITGYNKSDRLINLGSDVSLSKDSANSKHNFRFELTQNLKYPDFFKTKYFSNTIVYGKKMHRQLFTSGSLNYYQTKWELLVRAQYTIVKNYVYYDTTYTPKQIGNNINVISILLNKDLRIKHFVLSNNILFQKSSTLEIPLPQFYFRESFYYSGKLFKGALNCQIGVDLNYFTKYYGYGYYAPTAQYYVRYDKQVGDYPYMDFFINARIANARMFIKVDHFNSGLLGNEYFNLVNYPLPDRNIKFGVVWFLLN